MNGFRFVSKEFTIAQANDVVNFSMKMDKKSVICTGVTASVVTPAANNSNKICELGIIFSDKNTPFVIDVENTPVSSMKKHGTFEFQQVIKQNVNVDGFINDYGTSVTYPYTVNISFMVVDKTYV